MLQTAAAQKMGGGPSQSPAVIEKGAFRLAYDEQGITELANPRDPYHAEFLAAGGRLGDVLVRYRSGAGEWREVGSEGRRSRVDADGAVEYTDDSPGSPVAVRQWFHTDGRVLDWTISLHNRATAPVVVGDLAVQMPWRRPTGEDPTTIFERTFTKHQLICGYGSFLYFVRPSGNPPYLVVTVHPGTHLEYTLAGRGRGGFQAFVHSGVTGNAEKRGTWRQPHTFGKLGPAGSKNASIRIGFRFQWAGSYDEMRAVLYREGLFDIRVVPGMTIPDDLSAKLSLHTRCQIEAIQAEFPRQTTIRSLGAPKPGYHLYEVRFRRLGENLLTIHHDGVRTTVLEFFVTEPLETLIKKRARFITQHQQHRDPSKWYDGLFSIYDMKNSVLRGPDNTDGFDGWWGYVLACDDPGLCKAPYVAAKNVHFPDRDEIAAVEYYLKHFVWGKLQRTDKETPYPYGVYGVPNWKVARDPELRKRPEYRDSNQDKMHIWRSYDYPHIVMLYYDMYEIARLYPGMTHYLDAAGYLERAYQTARAYFLYPYEILPWYETYKVGCYNELVILNVIAALEREGRKADADWLRAEWEKKVKYFVYDDPYPFRSEYAIDRTAFESTYALAKYGATHDMKPDKDLWFDKRLKKWYSHPVVRRADSRAFMERQLLAGLAVRGWLETAYYLLGADFTGSSDTGSMSYMAQMGGWGILDYGLHFAKEPSDWLQLGYASYLSAWALMNTGRPDTNYGFWFPGPENDGAAGWQFMTAKFGRAWIRKDVPRGPWNYDGEIDLGFGGALRTAATILTRDPLFDWTAYGGTLDVSGSRLSVVPRDGLRQRFDVVLGPRRLEVELNRDGFAAGQPITTDAGLSRLRFTLENRTSDSHKTRLKLASAGTASYAVLLDGKRVGTARPGEISALDLSITRPTTVIELASRPGGASK